jgi:hypothetical protein
MHEYDGHLLYHAERGSIESRRNWDSPNPSPAGEGPPPPVTGGEAHSLTKDGLRESHFRRGDIHSGTLYIYVLCITGRILSLVLLWRVWWREPRDSTRGGRYIELEWEGVQPPPSPSW